MLFNVLYQIFLLFADIPVVYFSGHMKEMHKDDDTGFEREYKSVKDGGHSWEAGQLSENKFKKNRFTNIFPCKLFSTAF